MKNIEIINASAGSGKTFNLTKRVLEILIEGDNPESVMVTTFTNKAAAELKERTRVRLLENGHDEFAGRINDGFIGTVNSICARLLKEYAIEAGISPSVDTMAEEDSQRIFNISIDSVISEYASIMEGPAKRLELTGTGSGYSRTTDWREHVRKIVEIARANKIPGENLKLFAEASWKSFNVLLKKPEDADLTKELEAQLKIAINHLENCDIETKKTGEVLETLKNIAGKKDKINWSDWIKISKINPGKDGKDSCDQVIFAAEKVCFHEQFHKDIRQIITGSFECAIHAIEKYENYKREHALMDFTDQETLILDLALNNSSFRESLSNRISILMVDEFQDTSPVQLALFLALHELAGRSVWVGDPKQSIYGFRGTDPQLMEQFVKMLTQSRVLDFSWRSKENLVKFTNSIFTQVFDWMGKEKVELKIPPEREEEARGGKLEVWQLNAGNETDEILAVANAVYSFLNRKPEVKPGDIAILCRTNKQCEQIACGLENLKIRASTGQGNLLESRECRLALAALSFMNNENDDFSLAQIIRLLGIDSENNRWFSKLMTSPEETKQEWKKSGIFSSLLEGKNFVKYWTPLEALEEAINRIGLLKESKSWENNNLVRGNLDKLRFDCKEYINQCNSQRSSATIEGFVSWLKVCDTGKVDGVGEDTVNVLTYHRAKGLEWPWVVMMSLNTEPKSSVFGVNVLAAKEFDPVNPLAERGINYWPWPFGATKKYDFFEAVILDLPFAKDMHEKVIKEEQRLLYVGMTRAKNGLALAMRKKSDTLQTGWLNILTCNGKSDTPLLKFSQGIGEKSIKVGNVELPAEYFEFDACELEMVEFLPEEIEFLPDFPEIPADFPSARLSPSLLENFNIFDINIDETKFEIIEKFENRININQIVDMSALGNAIHSYLAIDTKQFSEEERLKLAKNIISNWQLPENSINPGDVVEIGNRLVTFLLSRYPKSDIMRECPMTFKTNEGQTIQGWIDMLIKTPDGFVIIDHKSYPGTDLDELVKRYVLQLHSYKLAVEKATGEKVIGLLLHLPVNGLVIEVDHRYGRLCQKSD